MPSRAIDRPLRAGSTIGILGGGQLGRMLALAAAQLGFSTHVYCPERDAPAFHVTSRHTCAPYGDRPALESFAADVDIVTYEFENVPAETASILLARVPVEPQPAILEITQDRLSEKSFLRGLDLAAADFIPVSDARELADAARKMGRSCVLKTRRLGYDGKGQVLIDGGSDVVRAWQTMGGSPAILEAFVPYSAELSVIIARGRDGALQIFDIPENRHQNHILRTSTVPAPIGPETAANARRIGTTIAVALGYVGVMAVELFLVREGAKEEILVNEIAPRVHNSGHWTQDACQISQFEMHIRAITGWPLPEPRRFCDVEMRNLLGNEVENALAFAAEPGTCVHIYGKSEARDGRKMGHVNRLRPLRDSKL